MKTKINNSFKEEFEEIPILIKSIKKRLDKKRKLSKIFWILLSSLIAIANITILIIASLALSSVIYDYNHSTKDISFLLDVAPVAGVSALSIIIFFTSLAISIYQGSMKSKIYLLASQDIQYEFLRYLSKENELTEKEFKKNIKSIYLSALRIKNKQSFKKSVISILTGGNDE
ncbi:MAG: hypothetical protein HRT99_01730 [Mycoplasmatales bacterium]|nr:hypothetical protein [Mycoplasmatales bacterium]